MTLPVAADGAPLLLRQALRRINRHGRRRIGALNDDEIVDALDVADLRYRLDHYRLPFRL